MAKTKANIEEWFCEECEDAGRPSYFKNPLQFMSDDLPCCPECKSESIKEVRYLENALLKSKT